MADVSELSLTKLPYFFPDELSTKEKILIFNKFPTFSVLFFQFL